MSEGGGRKGSGSVWVEVLVVDKSEAEGAEFLEGHVVFHHIKSPATENYIFFCVVSIRAVFTIYTETTVPSVVGHG